MVYTTQVTQLSVVHDLGTGAKIGMLRLAHAGAQPGMLACYLETGDSDSGRSSHCKALYTAVNKIDAAISKLDPNALKY